MLIPVDLDWIAIVNGALTLFSLEDLYEAPDGHLSAQDVISELLVMWQDSLAGCPDTGVTMPVGAIVYMATVTLPDNMLWCDGSEYLGADYPELYAVIANAFKTPDEKFITPDLAHRFLRADFYTPIGTEGGESSHLLTVDEMPAHTHEVPQRVLAGGAYGYAATGGSTAASPIITSSAGGNVAHNNIPPYMNLLPAIVAASS